jgi:hypothetical protein
MPIELQVEQQPLLSDHMHRLYATLGSVGKRRGYLTKMPYLLTTIPNIARPYCGRSV